MLRHTLQNDPANNRRLEGSVFESQFQGTCANQFAKKDSSALDSIRMMADFMLFCYPGLKLAEVIKIFRFNGVTEVEKVAETVINNLFKLNDYNISTS